MLWIDIRSVHTFSNYNKIEHIITNQHIPYQSQMQPLQLKENNSCNLGRIIIYLSWLTHVKYQNRAFYVEPPRCNVIRRWEFLDLIGHWEPPSLKWDYCIWKEDPRNLVPFHQASTVNKSVLPVTVHCLHTVRKSISIVCGSSLWNP